MQISIEIDSSNMDHNLSATAFQLYCDSYLVCRDAIIHPNGNSLVLKLFVSATDEHKKALAFELCTKLSTIGCDIRLKYKQTTDESSSTTDESYSTSDESSRTNDESYSTSDESSRTNDESYSTSDESSRTNDESSRTTGESSNTNFNSTSEEEVEIMDSDIFEWTSYILDVHVVDSDFENTTPSRSHILPTASSVSRIRSYLCVCFLHLLLFSFFI